MYPTPHKPNTYPDSKLHPLSIDFDLSSERSLLSLHFPGFLPLPSTPKPPFTLSLLSSLNESNQDSIPIPIPPVAGRTVRLPNPSPHGRYW
eukprot:204695-Amorphochlora_amoeboformis.AAC.1